MNTYARLDDPRAIVESRVVTKMWALLLGGALLVIAPWALYVLAAVYHVNPIEWGRPARDVELFLLVVSIPLSIGGLGLIWLALRRYRPLSRRGAQTAGWVEEVGPSATPHWASVTFGYEVAGVRYKLLRAQPEVEVALYDDRTRVVVMYDTAHPSRGDVVVHLAEDADRFSTRLHKALELSFGDFGWRALQLLLAFAHYGALYVAYELAPLSKDVKDRLMVALVFVVLGVWFWECHALDRWRARRRSQTYHVHWLTKMYWTLWLVGPLTWLAWEILKLIRQRP